MSLIPIRHNMYQSSVKTQTNTVMPSGYITARRLCCPEGDLYADTGPYRRSRNCLSNSPYLRASRSSSAFLSTQDTAPDSPSSTTSAVARMTRHSSGKPNCLQSTPKITSNPPGMGGQANVNRTVMKTAVKRSTF